MNRVTNIIGIFISGFSLISCSKTNIAEKKPNIIILLADDLGFGDVGYNGSDIKTPHIDKIASEGARFNQFYACPMCSPTRAGLMTGRYPVRFGLMRSAISPQCDFGLSANEETIADMLGKAAYDYRGIIGKWHLGYHRPVWVPLNRGFTYFKGCLNGAVNYFNRNLSISPKLEGRLDWYLNGQLLNEEGYTTDLIGDAAVDFINSVPDNKPFFLYVPFTAPHGPFNAKPEDEAKYPEREGVKRTYAGMVDNMDQNIGKILSCLKQRGQLDDTFILFCSDNGGLLKGASNGELRGGKLTPYQGGIRVVAAARWPSGGISGGKIIEERIGYIDILPTLMAVAGYGGKPKNELDGQNVLAVMKGETITDDRSWFTYEDQGDDKIEDLAINTDQWKLIVSRPAPDAGSKGSPAYKLFRIDSDPNEELDLASQYPDKVEELFTEIEKFYSIKVNPQVPRYSEKGIYSEQILKPAGN